MKNTFAYNSKTEAVIEKSCNKLIKIIEKVVLHRTNLLNYVYEYCNNLKEEIINLLAYLENSISNIWIISKSANRIIDFLAEVAWFKDI